MKDWVKFVPAVVLLITFVATTAVSQYQISELVESDAKQRETLVIMTVNQAEMAVKIDHLEKP